MIPENKISTYIKVKALAHWGSPGEKKVAALRLGELEQKYPGIKQAAQRRASYPDAEAKPTETQPTSPLNTGNWENIFEHVRGFASTAYTVAQQVLETQYGNYVADHVTMRFNHTPLRGVTITTRMTPDVVDAIRGLNYAQRQAFRDDIHRHFDEQLDTLMEE